jgi:AcrR family transcriptional regulator
MSIYHHFPSKADLMDAMVDRFIAEMVSPPATLPVVERIRFTAYEFRRVGRLHPAFFPYFATSRLNSPVALAWLDSTLALFHAAGCDDRTAAHLFRSVGYYVTGATLDETNGYAKGPSSLRTVGPEEMAARFPNVFAAGAYFNPSQWDVIFERGLNLILADLARQGQADTNAPSPLHGPDRLR